MNVHRSKQEWDRWAFMQGYEHLPHFLEELYAKQGRTMEEVAAQMGIRRDRVAQLLRAYGIPVRPRGGYFG